MDAQRKRWEGMRKETEIPAMDGTIQAGGEPCGPSIAPLATTVTEEARLGSCVRPEMAPQRVEKTEFAPGNWERSRVGLSISLLCGDCRVDRAAEKGACPFEHGWSPIDDGLCRDGREPVGFDSARRRRLAVSVRLLFAEDLLAQRLSRLGRSPRLAGLRFDQSAPSDHRFKKAPRPVACSVRGAHRLDSGRRQSTVSAMAIRLAPSRSRRVGI